MLAGPGTIFPGPAARRMVRTVSTRGAGVPGPEHGTVGGDGLTGHGRLPDHRERFERGDQFEYPREYGSVDEYDLPAEVDASVRTLRRVAVGYFAVFLVVVLAVPGLTLALDWWSQGRLIGGMSPSFVMAAGGLYLFFFVLAVAAATLANAVEQRMLGGPGHDVDDQRSGEP